MYRSYRNNDGYDLQVSLITLGVIILLMLISSIITSINDSYEWNNGYCTCGGQWQYEQAVGHRYDTDYIYKCDKCGTVHEFKEFR